MALIPPPTDLIAEAIDAHHAARVELPRAHLGASILGHHCERWLWLSFRWAVIERFKGRTLRLFRRGHNEEATIVADLKAIGIEIHSTEGGQARVDFGCHVGGSIDGIIESGVPGAPTKRHIAEFKTHSKKSFDDVLKVGVEISKPMHYAQMQAYMHGTQIDRALYLAVCKDDDRLYTERVRYDEAFATKLIAKGHRLVMDNLIPPPISTNPSWYECKWCPAHSFCHGGQQISEKNCRTCNEASPVADGTWHCSQWDATIPLEAQVKGCEQHMIHWDMGAKI